MRRVAETFVAEPTAATVARMRELIRRRVPFVPIHPRLTPAERDALRPDLAAIPDG